MADLNIRADKALKKQAEIILGEVRIDPFYSAENQDHLLTAKERMECTGGTVRELIEVDDD